MQKKTMQSKEESAFLVVDVNSPIKSFRKINLPSQELKKKNNGHMCFGKFKNINDSFL